ncbi:MAG: hypothetical protein GWO41_12640 [candidate division Zixibacteria bacterium]|nr:hypothetical protein [candidate division Zixibacteria bacterium]NIR62746.1 hypothetical protein [candidate division Zixibacteria bacterium]NIS17198.1 hypothetical protein [candidate division Zixibacteria bacterium]NIS44816.1 hypothetical protein [candidate division Zixibacteria bacterium]NIT53551.1 hypothetical protein [candidate division Zixibacteria bacterium]
MKKIILIAITIFAIASINAVADDPKAGEEINWQVLSNGGTEGSSTNYGLKGTVSQTAVDQGTSTNYKLKHGFWQIFATSGGPCQGECGDANDDASVNVSDAVWIVNYVFIGGSEPLPVLACGDANTDGSVNVSDAVWVINFVFVGGGPPSTCSPGSPNWYNGDCCPFAP